MKRSLYIVIFTFLFFPLFAYAQVDINNETDLKNNLSSGADIRLTANITVTTNLFVQGESTIDLNGFTIDMTNKTLVPYKTLTVKDTSDSESGKITSTAQNTLQVGGSTKDGSFVLESGTIDCRGTYCVNNYGQITINGGRIEGNNYTIINRKSLTMNGGTVHSRDNIAVGLTENTTFTLNDGLVETMGDNCAVFVSASGAEFTMNGGRIEALYEDVPNHSTGGIGIFTRGNTQVTINGGTILADGFAINGNGSYENTNITINGGDIESLHLHAIYAPEKSGEVKITGGTITGLTALEVRGGVLNITGGTFNATSDYYVIGSNDNGTTTKGVAVAIVQHVTKKPIEVHICGGTFNGIVPFAQANAETNPLEDVNKISLLIDNSCGVPVFNSLDGNKTVFSENFDSFIFGGKFTTDVGKYIAPKYGEVLENGMQVVYLYNNIIVDDDDIEVVESELRNNVVTVITPDKPGYVVDKIIVTDENGNVIPVRNNKFIMPASDVHIKVLYIPEGEVKGDDIINPITRDLIRCYIHILFTAIMGISLVVINKKLLID